MSHRLLAALAVTLVALTGCADNQHRPLEDQPGWNCVVDGNGHCGPTYSGTVRLVAQSDPYWACDFDGSDDADDC